MLIAPTMIFSPIQLFAAGEQGLWLDPSDMSTMFQDSAGTTPVTAVEQSVGLIRDKSGRGNHASQSTSGSRPVLSARVNLLVATNTLSTQSVTTVAGTYTLSFSGAGSITLSGTKTGTYSAGSNSLTGVTSGTLTLTVSGTVTNADLRVTNDGVGLPSYQRVNTSTDYDTIGFPMYLRFESANTSSLSTSSINFTGTDKMSIWAGVRKQNDTGAIVAELSANTNTNTGTFYLVTGTNAGYSAGYSSLGRGTATASTGQVAGIASRTAPNTAVLSVTHDIPGDLSTLRANQTAGTNGTVDKGSGSFGNYPIYIGARAGTGVRLTGRIYSLIIRGAASTNGQLLDTEGWVNGRTRAY